MKKLWESGVICSLIGTILVLVGATIVLLGPLYPKLTDRPVATDRLMPAGWCGVVTAPERAARRDAREARTFKELWVLYVRPETAELLLGTKKPVEVTRFAVEIAQVAQAVYAPWAVEIRAGGLAPDTGVYPANTNVLVIQNALAMDRVTGVLGRATEVDEWNKHVNQLTGPLFGVFGDVSMDALVALVSKNPTRTQKVYFIGNIVAHEIGHALGMSHIDTPKRDVMSAGAFTQDGKLAFGSFQAVNICYLDRVVPKKGN